MSANNMLNVINPDGGKRYRLNMKGDIGRLTIGRLKQCLAAASSCPIPANEQVLKLNGIPLSNDADVCALYGITRGTTLTVENRAYVHPSPASPASLASPQRRALEHQTIRAQESALFEDVTASGAALHGKMERLRDELQEADHRRFGLEREKARAERELEVLKQREEIATRERERIAKLRAQEGEYAARRAADLAARRVQLKADEEAVRAVAMQKLDNERRKSQVEQQRAEFEAEKECLRREREAYEERAKEREMKIREKEMEIEQKTLAAERDRKEVALSRLISQQSRAQYFNNLGLVPPPELLSPSKRPQVNIFAACDENKRARVKRKENYTNHRDSPTVSLCSEAYPAAIFNGEEIITSASEAGDRHAGDESDVSFSRTIHVKAPYNAYDNALANLRSMEDFLPDGQSLAFDSNHTCVIGVDGEFTLLVTFDAATERLYLYSTLIDSIPTNPEVRMRVYEFLMDGALLGREMCGGGVGASLKNGFIVMSTSMHLPTCHPMSLRVITPMFVKSLKSWRKELHKLLAEFESATPQPTLPKQQHRQKHKEEKGGLLESQSGTKRQEPYEYPYYSPLPPWSTPQNSVRHTHDPPGETNAPTPNGHARAVIGIEATESTTANRDACVLVVNVAGPAAQAGIQVQDCIRKVDGNDVRSLAEFQREVARLLPKSVVPFLVERGGLELVVAVKAATSA